MSDEQRPDRNLAIELVRVTEAAALAAGPFIGRGDKIAADQAAVDGMRLMVDTVSMQGVVVIGDDFPAVDATCARIMGVAPERVDHLRWAGGFLGNVDEERIVQLAEGPAQLRQEFALPPGFATLRG